MIDALVLPCLNSQQTFLQFCYCTNSMSFVLLNWQEKNSKADPAVQNTSTRDAEHSPAKEIPSTLQRKSSGNSIAQFQPSSPKKSDGFVPPANSVMRRRRSSEGLGTDESFTGTRVVTFSSKGEHVVHCGKCLGKVIAVDHSRLWGRGSDSVGGVFVKVFSKKVIGFQAKNVWIEHFKRLRKTRLHVHPTSLLSSPKYRAANSFSFLKRHMSDQVSILVGQNRNEVGRFFNFWNNYFLPFFTCYLVKKLCGHNVRPKLRFCRT